MRMVACTSGGGGVTLSAGTHSFSAANLSRPFEVTTGNIQEATPVTLSTPLARTATIQSWNAENRSIKVSAGPATYLAGAELQHRLDGHPRGPHPQTHPTRRVAAGLRPPGRVGRCGQHGHDALTGSSACCSPSVPHCWWPFSARALLPGRRKDTERQRTHGDARARVLFVGTLVVLGLISGPLALVAVPLVLIGRRWGRATLAVTAFVAFLVAGVAAAWDPAVAGSTGAGAFSPLAQIAWSLPWRRCSVLVLDGGRGKGRGDVGGSRAEEPAHPSPVTRPDGLREESLERLTRLSGGRMMLALCP